MNSYITKSLEHDESVILLGHYHWTFTACKTIGSIVLALAGVALLVFTHFRPEHAITLPGTAIALMGASLVMAMWANVLRSCTEFAVTDTRFIQKDGLLDISIKEIPLSKVETVNFHQTLLQRILGTGSIELVGSGGTTHRIAYIADPMQVKRAIARAMGSQSRTRERPQTDASLQDD